MVKNKPLEFRTSYSLSDIFNWVKEAIPQIKSHRHYDNISNSMHKHREVQGNGNMWGHKYFKGKSNSKIKFDLRFECSRRSNEC